MREYSLEENDLGGWYSSCMCVHCTERQAEKSTAAISEACHRMKENLTKREVIAVKYEISI